MTPRHLSEVCRAGLDSSSDFRASATAFLGLSPAKERVLKHAGQRLPHSHTRRANSSCKLLLAT
eukprot:4027306-Alexandrium_andersonii.AAC.1